MSVAVSRPGLVSQRQCKVTARRTRTSRYRHVCNGPQPPFPALSPAIISPPAPPLPNCMSVSSLTYPHVAPTVATATFRRATYFLCSAPAPFTTHATAAITAYSPPHRRPQKMPEAITEICRRGNLLSVRRKSSISSKSLRQSPANKCRRLCR